jgi:hypothetical protein
MLAFAHAALVPRVDEDWECSSGAATRRFADTTATWSSAARPVPRARTVLVRRAGGRMLATCGTFAQARASRIAKPRRCLAPAIE